jgi:predicted ester cyclase
MRRSNVDADTLASEKAIRHCVELYNACNAGWVDACYDSSALWTELPTSATPHGRHGGRDVLRQVAEQTLAMFPDRQLTIRDIVAQGQHVAAELEWVGTAARALGPLKAGATLRLRVASFFGVINGLISSHTDYCVPTAGE